GVVNPAPAAEPCDLAQRDARHVISVELETLACAAAAGERAIPRADADDAAGPAIGAVLAAVSLLQGGRRTHVCLPLARVHGIHRHVGVEYAPQCRELRR